MSIVSPSTVISVLRLAYDAGVDWDRAGFTFRLGYTSDDYSIDGPPTTGWYHWCRVWAGGDVVLSSHPYKAVEGPWFDDLPGVLEEIRTEAVAILEQRKADKAAEEAAKKQAEELAAAQHREAQVARYQREKNA